MTKPGPKDLKPPDLWMDHDQMELKNLEGGLGGGGSPGMTTIPQDGSDGGMMMEDRRNSFISKCAV